MTQTQDHVSDTLQALLEDLRARRDNEISMASEVLGQYVTDHNDTAAYRAIDKQVNQLARAWDRMIAKLERWQVEAVKIEQSCENFYGDSGRKVVSERAESAALDPGSFVRLVPIRRRRVHRP